MKKLISIIALCLMLVSSCTKDNTPDLLPGTWLGEYEIEVIYSKRTEHYTISQTLEITYLSPSKSYDVEVKGDEYMFEPGTINNYFQFHLNGKKIVVDSGFDFGLNGARIITLDEKNLILELDRPTEYRKETGYRTTVYPSNLYHYRRQ